MKLHTIYRTQRIFSDLKKIWSFFSSPLNLATITPKWLNFTVLSEIPEKMYEGIIIEYKITPLLNIPVKWITEITHIKEPYFFVDEQRFGPYKFWHHKHFFIQKDGFVEMIDKVDYILPYGIFGKMIHPYVAEKLKEIFDYRQKKVDEIFN
jgi:ligand-binding SRPBCC domain-containing protein